MPSCVNCGATLKCTCEHPEQPIGQTVLSCPKLAKGKLWIHVTDDLGANLKTYRYRAHPKNSRIAQAWRSSKN